jgi:hypothetical protein
MKKNAIPRRNEAIDIITGMNASRFSANVRIKNKKDAIISTVPTERL